MRLPLYAKLVLVAAVVLAIATATLDIAVHRSWETSLRAQLTARLTQEVDLFAQDVGHVPRPGLAPEIVAAAKATHARATVIAANGVVLGDSEADARKMENHSTRPEFIAALRGRIGENTRRSHTLGIEFQYVAAPVTGGAVRLAYPLTAVRETLATIRRTLWLASLVAFGIAIGLAVFAASRLSRRVTTDLAETALRLQGTVQDLETTRKQQAALLASLQDAVVAVTPDLRILWANQAFDKLAPAPGGAASLLDRVRAPEVLDSVRQSLAKAELQRAMTQALEPGRVHQYTVSTMPGGVVVVFHDLTEVERLAAIRRDFLANVSHELRTPLANIQGYAETLTDALLGRQEEPVDAQLAAIQRNVERMARLTNDLMTLARVETGEWKFDLEPQPAATLLQEAATHLRDLAEKRGHTLAVVATSRRPVLADAEAIHQVFTNLIQNAALYAPPSTPIEIGADDEAGAVRFFVRDYGPGIASTHHARLFERFYRVDPARSTMGTGLGLAIMKHIVLNHRGRVGVDSEVGSGAEFWFTLPLA